MLYVRPAHRTTEQAWEDLTARARIRDSALLQFAEHGIKGATIRSIAESAGVSPALVQHHFGSKDGLREACDGYVLETVRGDTKQAISGRRLSDPDFIAGVYQTAPSIMRYLIRALVEGSPAAASLFDELVAVAEEFLASVPYDDSSPPLSDRRTQAAVLTAMKLGVFVLHEHLDRALDVETLTDEGFPRIGAALLDIVSPTFVGTDVAASARTGLERYLRKDPGTPPSKERAEEDRDG